MPVHEQWRFCRKCGGLFQAGESAGRCPVGAAHLAAPEERFLLHRIDPDAPGVPAWRGHWRRCRACAALFSPGRTAGRCPAAGEHVAAAGEEYLLGFVAAGESGWMRCVKCHMLCRPAMGPGERPARCAAGGRHELDDDSEYDVRRAPDDAAIDDPVPGAVPGADGAATAPEHARAIRKVGTWLRDACGRYLLLRGVNFGARVKLPPYLPIYPLDSADHRRHDRVDLDTLREEIAGARKELVLLRESGCNVVRLLLLWKGLEPRVNQNLESLLPEGEEYLHQITEIIEELWALGIHVFIDFHQDIAHEVYGGDGFPDWAIAVDERHPRPATSSLRDRAWTIQYYDTMFAANRDLARNTLRSFWRNSLTNIETGLRNFPARTHFVKTVGQVARYFSELYGGDGHPAVLGYEIFNEPHQCGIDRVEFERDLLPEFYREAIAEVRRFDPDALILVEPRVDWTIYAARGPEFQYIDFTDAPETGLAMKAADPSDQLLLSFHHYDAYTMYCGAAKPIIGGWGDDMFSKELEWPRMFTRFRQAAIERDMVPFLTEFGADQGWLFPTAMRPRIYGNVQVRAYMDLQFRQVEAFLLNATYWNWDLYNTRDGHDNWNFEDFSLLGPERAPRNLDVATRPYPRRSSAMPVSLSFDLQERLAVIVLEGEPVEAPTEIFVPREMHYREGFRADATGRILGWDGEQRLLLWLPDPRRERNILTIAPADAPEKLVAAALGDLAPDEWARAVFR